MSAKPCLSTATARSATATHGHAGSAEDTVGRASHKQRHQLVMRGVQLAQEATAPPNLSITDGLPPSDVQTVLVERVVSLRTRRRTFYECHIKPAADRVAAALLLTLSAPVMAGIALAVRLTLGSPVLFRQARIGQDGRTFYMLKFRTMRPDRRTGQCHDYCGPERRVTHKSADDPRHTRLGRKLRKTSLDELPQLFNVLRGDMSLIGPRPELAEIVEERYTGWQHVRHAVRPGITGLWQVTERANGRLMHECVEVDLAYIERLSLRVDVAIAFRTPLALLRRDGVV